MKIDYKIVKTTACASKGRHVLVHFRLNADNTIKVFQKSSQKNLYTNRNQKIKIKETIEDILKLFSLKGESEVRNLLRSLNEKRRYGPEKKYISECVNIYKTF